jgi:hypothetical protein
VNRMVSNTGRAGEQGRGESAWVRRPGHLQSPRLCTLTAPATPSSAPCLPPASVYALYVAGNLYRDQPPNAWAQLQQERVLQAVMEEANARQRPARAAGSASEGANAEEGGAAVGGG